MKLRTYSELRRIESFHERYEYLRLNCYVGEKTFGSERYLNQQFYRSREWKLVRQKVIARDMGMDLGVEDHEIHGRIIIHHMNPMVSDDLIHGNSDILDPEFLITTTHDTHNAIHYGDENLLAKPFVERFPGDTKPW